VHTVKQMLINIHKLMQWLLWLVGLAAPVSLVWMCETYTESPCLID